MGLAPAQIMEFSETSPNTYTVILADFKKYTGVVPAAEQKPDPEPVTVVTKTRRAPRKKAASGK